MRPQITSSRGFSSTQFRRPSQQRLGVAGRRSSKSFWKLQMTRGQQPHLPRPHLPFRLLLSQPPVLLSVVEGVVVNNAGPVLRGRLGQSNFATFISNLVTRRRDVIHLARGGVNKIIHMIHRHRSSRWKRRWTVKTLRSGRKTCKSVAKRSRTSAPTTTCNLGPRRG